MWILCGDFNAIRHRKDRSGPNFDVRIFRNFHAFLNDPNLIEHRLMKRKYTWNNGRQFALLDRVFSSIEWDYNYSHSILRDLSQYGSDHFPLLLKIMPKSAMKNHMFHFDPVTKEEFDPPSRNL